MFRARVIPCLLLKGDGLVKTVRFKEPKYVGDPINAVKIFNEKEVDELIFLDITATPEGRTPSFERVRNIASECFMPMCYGGGVRSLEHSRQLFNLGVEKVALNTAAAETPALITELANAFGNQSIIVGVDVKNDWLGRPRVFTHCGTKNTGRGPVEYIREMEERGAGEILLNSVDRDGTMRGFDVELIREVTKAVHVPVVACGGAGSVAHLGEAVTAGASGVAAGSLFVFTGPHRAVLINYPTAAELQAISH
ncbi:MAG: imidazole glycerol phosphate synthase subunit HisF [Verrucomicrobia bacterium]|nr:imidazole glycerol phosphate synthase subunit HisF [Verrucomicrobiota bacterium]